MKFKLYKQSRRHPQVLELCLATRGLHHLVVIGFSTSKTIFSPKFIAANKKYLIFAMKDIL